MPCFSVAADHGGKKTALIQFMISEFFIRKSYLPFRQKKKIPHFRELKNYCQIYYGREKKARPKYVKVP